MHQVTNDLAVFPTTNEVVIAVLDSGTWIDMVHVRWSDVPRLLAALEDVMIKDGKVDEWLTLPSRFHQVHRELVLCQRNLTYQIERLSRWTRFEADLDERLRALGMSVPVGESITDAVLAWMDRQIQLKTDHRHGA